MRGLEKAYEERDKSDSGAYAAEYIRNFLEGEPIPGIEKELEMTRAFFANITLEEVERKNHAEKANQRDVISFTVTVIEMENDVEYDRRGLTTIIHMV